MGGRIRGEADLKRQRMPHGWMGSLLVSSSCVDKSDDLVSILRADEVAWCGYRRGPIRPRQQHLQHHTHGRASNPSRAGNRITFQRLFRTGLSQCLVAEPGCALPPRESLFPADGDRKTILRCSPPFSVHTRNQTRAPSKPALGCQSLLHISLPRSVSNSCDFSASDHPGRQHHATPISWEWSSWM